MANVAFKKGLLANLPSTKTAGTFYVTTDERAIYLDVDASNRIRLGDFQEFATVAALEANTNPSTTALYYVTAINCLAKWNGTSYVQINLDTGATSIEVVGDGNAVTAASYSATTRKITLTKGSTFALQGADTDASSAITLYGVKKYAQEQAAAVLGSNSDSAGDATVYGANKAAAAAQAEAEAKVASVTAGNDGIEIGGTSTAPTVGLKLSAKNGNGLSIETGTGEEGLYFKQAAAPEYTIAQQQTAESGYAATYYMTKDGTQVGSKINIPKDFLVKSASVETVETADTPYSGAVVGDKYIDFVINAKDSSATAEHLYLPVNDLVDVYTSGSASGDMVVIAIDSSNQITATISDGTITLAKLHSDVQAEINKSHTHSNKALLDTYTQTEANLADAVSKKHAHSNATVLDGISATDVSNWDGEIGANAAITAMKDGTSLDSFGDVEGALSDIQDGTSLDSFGDVEGALSDIQNGSSIDSFGDTEDALALKAPLASPALTGTPTAPTAAAGTDSTQIATTAFVKAAVDAGLEWGSF